MANTPDSGTGPDGIPNSAWQALGLHGASVLYGVFVDMCTDATIPHGLNHLRKCFVRKKLFVTHRGGIAAKPNDLRPLGLKNSDIKAIASSVNLSMSPIVSKHAHFSQRGFVRGRNFLLNVVELDTFARLFSLVSSSPYPPPDLFPLSCSFLCFFDFCSAFPSVAQEYLFKVLKFYDIPNGLYNFFVALFFDVAAFTSASGLNRFLFLVESGVIQGDPLAGVLFVLVLDPILHMFYNVFEKPGLGYCRACADDIGVVMRDIAGLVPLYSAFQLIFQATSMSLNIPKCILIPLNLSLSHAYIHEWLSTFTPQFPI